MGPAASDKVWEVISYGRVWNCEAQGSKAAGSVKNTLSPALFINVFLHFWFAVQNVNESPIHLKKKFTTKYKQTKRKKKTYWKGLFKRVRDWQQNTTRPKIKRNDFKNGIWFMTNYNLEWLWNCHNDDHQNTHFG